MYLYWQHIFSFGSIVDKNTFSSLFLLVISIRSNVFVSDETVSCEAVVPKFITELITQEVIIGQPVTMSCDVIGTPTPDVTWYQVGTDV